MKNFNFKNLGGLTYTDTGAIILIVIGALMLAAMIIFLCYWIRYSLIRRTNSQNLNGAQVTQKILSTSPELANTEIKKSWMYAKYWNHNKRRNTYRLRPWTYSRQSLWTIMEATSQAYASTIRAEKGKTFWLLFRIPSLIRIASIIVEVVVLYFLIDANSSTSILIISIVALVGIPFLIANCGALYLLMKNTMPLVKQLGLTEEEVKIIHRIFVLRFVYAVVITILDLIKTAVQISEARGNMKK